MVEIPENKEYPKTTYPGQLIAKLKKRKIYEQRDQRLSFERL